MVLDQDPGTGRSPGPKMGPPSRGFLGPVPRGGPEENIPPGWRASLVSATGVAGGKNPEAGSTQNLWTDPRA